MKKIVSEDIRSVLNKMNTIMEKSGDPEDGTKDIVGQVSNLKTDAPNISINREFGDKEMVAVISLFINYIATFGKLVRAYEHTLSLSGAKKVVADMHPSIEELESHLKHAVELAKNGKLETVGGLYDAIFKKMEEFEHGFEQIAKQINGQWKADHLLKYEKFTRALFKAMKQMPENIQRFKKKLDIVRNTDFHKTHSHAKVGRDVQPMA